MFTICIEILFGAPTQLSYRRENKVVSLFLSLMSSYA